MADDKKRARDARYRARHPEKRHAYYLEHREHERATNRAWFERHATERAAYNIVYNARHRSEKRAYFSAYRLAHRDELNARTSAYMREIGKAARNARVRGAPVVERIYRKVVFERDGGRCHICHKLVDPTYWHLDHLVPLSKGGEHSYRNVAVAHPACNLHRNATGPAQLRLTP